MNANRSRDKPCLWLLSAYRADSHAAWADWLVAHVKNVEWRRLELPGRHFGWRIRGNPLSWLDRLPTRAPDRILATAMVDLATIKGLHPALANVPADYYFHENQFAYPASDRQVTSVEARMVQLYGALAAQRLLFNSAYNRDSFLHGVRALIRSMPDARPPDLIPRLAAKCHVLPVPVKPIAPAPDKDPRLIVWNHRWEYDKAPEIFADAILALAGIEADFRLALLGPRPRVIPEALARLRRQLPDRIVADGKLPTDDYRRLLSRAGIVVSTARHEFQGLSVLEAASAGARPLVPDALCYPEQFSPEYRYPAGDAAALTRRLAQWLNDGPPPRADVTAWSARLLLPLWCEWVGGAGAG